MRSVDGEAFERTVRDVRLELESAVEKFASFNSAHEGWAVIYEEIEELWDEVKANNPVRARAEAIQVAAMAIRYLIDIPEPIVSAHCQSGAAHRVCALIGCMCECHQ